ncbi:MAG: hypothetical protein J7L53_02940 [Deltaproteobacteria bacterium]|nr:hypothetical protein [Deltaproteobacteria bacterium]
MRKQLATATIFGILFILPLLAIAQEQATLTVQGIGVIEDGNIAKAEHLALEDGLNKALLTRALQYVPMSSTYALVKSLPSYISYRGTNDISQYQIMDKLKQGNVLRLIIELKLKDEHIKQWLCAQTLNIPRLARSKIITMISSKDIGEENTYKWWTVSGEKRYSAFESQLTSRLLLWGENVIKDPPEIKRHPYESADPIELASKAKADLVLVGSIEYIPETQRDNIYSCILDIKLIDVYDRTELGSWSIVRKSDLQIEEMNSLMVDYIIGPVRDRIAYKILSISPEVVKKQVCIEEIYDYNTYQSMVNALSAMANVSQIKISKIKGHSIWHTIDIKGNLDDIMNSLKRQQIADIDIEIKDDTAFIRIIHH